MQYETFIENYTPELQLVDALDMLKHFEPKAAEILDQWASESNNERTGEEPHQTGPLRQLSLKIFNCFQLIGNPSISLREI